MLRRTARTTWLLVLLCGSPVLAAEDAPPGTVPSPVKFNRDIRPILSNHCFKCHGPAVHEAELRLDVSEAAKAGLPSGARAIVPGDAAASALIERITAHDVETRMPPEAEGKPLSAAQIELLKRWVSEGAVYEGHWAYQPLVRPAVPEVKQRDWPRNEIDHFILARLEQTGLAPAPEASRATLARRASLDVTGLPPKLDELHNFVADHGADAYSQYIRGLLASPHYGERQALAWLDLARYADSDGYPHDGNRTMWPYRDWVVEAFNADMPYDQFTIEQLAGDLLPDATPSQRLASAFHRQTRINKEAGVDPEEFRIEAVIDRVNTTATVWLGATLGCAQCHDHKFDPYPQRDYYRLLAFFNSNAVETTTDPAGRITDVSPRMALQVAGLSAPVNVLVMRELDQPRATHVFQRGSFLSPGEVVAPGTPSVVDTLPAPEGRDRLALARWLVDKRNPLTARVAVNRLWAQYFGTGLVETLDDFGTQSPQCSHPELLDWLATELMRHDWHWKPLHALILTSATYRQCSTTSPEAVAADPANRLLARASRLRLPAELVRDAALSAGGVLKGSLGGPTVAADSSGGGRAYRRSIYVHWKRQTLDDMLATFDAPNRDVTCTRRARTNTPLQALTLLNHPAFLDAARGLAVSACAEGRREWRDQLDYASEAVLSRRMSEEESKTLRALFERRRSELAADTKAIESLLGSAPEVTENAGSGSPADQAAWVLVANTLLNLNEAITRE